MLEVDRTWETRVIHTQVPGPISDPTVDMQLVGSRAGADPGWCNTFGLGWELGSHCRLLQSPHPLAGASREGVGHSESWHSQRVTQHKSPLPTPAPPSLVSRVNPQAGVSWRLRGVF